MSRPRQSVSTLLFDLDGTLTDPREGITRCLQYGLERLGRAFPDQAELIQYIGPPLRWTFPRLLGTDDADLVDAAVRHYRDRFADVGLFENTLYAGVPELLDTLQRRGFELLVVTAKPKVYADRIISHFGLDSCFAGVFGPQLDGHLDDKIELLAHVLAERCLRPERTMMIGDRATDIAAGKANGTRTLAVTYGFGSLQELTAAGPDRICDSPPEIRNVLDGG